MIQSRDALCYHLTCRGHRWNKGVGIENSDYKETMTRCGRDFIRKWGDWIHNDKFQYPIINPKYDVGFKIHNCNLELLKALEPWCSTVYCDEQFAIGRVSDYVEMEDTTYDLYDKILSYDADEENDILIMIDGNTFGNEEFRHIQNLSSIIQGSGEIGRFELGNLNITVNNLETYESKLVNYEK